MGPSHGRGAHMGMSTSRKGVFFTVIAILLIVVFLFYFTIHTYQKQTARQAIAEKRIQSTNEFIENMERDVSRGGYITSYPSLLSLKEYIC